MNKPHIFFRAGYWCVSPMPRPYFTHAKLWRKAHDVKMLLNYRLRCE